MKTARSLPRMLSTVLAVSSVYFVAGGCAGRSGGRHAPARAEAAATASSEPCRDTRPVNGGEPTILAASQGRPSGIAVDADTVYWTTLRPDGAVLRLDKP